MPQRPIPTLDDLRRFRGEKPPKDVTTGADIFRSLFGDSLEELTGAVDTLREDVFPVVGKGIQSATEIPVIGDVIGAGIEGLTRLSNAAGGGLKAGLGESLKLLEADHTKPWPKSDPFLPGVAAIDQMLAEITKRPVQGRVPQEEDLGMVIAGEENPNAAFLVNLLSPGLKGAGAMMKGVQPGLSIKIVGAGKKPIKVKPKDLEGIDKEFLEELPNMRDLGSVQSGAVGKIDFLRAAKVIERKENGPLRRILRPVEEANFQRAKENDAVNKEFTKVLGDIKPGSDSSKQIFRFIDVDPVTRKPRNTRKLNNKEMEVVRYLKNQYSRLLDEMNASRTKVGLQPIPKREDYINHVWEMSITDRLFGLASPDMELQKMLTASGKGKAPFAQFMLKRGGKEGFEEDAIRAFNRYLPTALRMKHMPEAVLNTRKHINLLPNNAKEFYNNWLDEGALGKRGQLDKAIDKKGVVIEPLSAVSQRLARNLISGNISTAILQLSSTPQVLAGGGVGRGLLAMGWTMGPGWKFAQQNSKVLQLRKFESFEDAFRVTYPSQLEHAVNTPLRVFDQLNVAWSFNAGYFKAKSLGLRGQEAIEYADDFAFRTQAVYDRLYKSAFMRNRVVSSTIGQFQNWTNNLANFMQYDMLPIPGRHGDPTLTMGQKAYRTAVFAGTVMAMNTIYEELGLRKPFDGVETFVPYAQLLRGIPGFEKISGFPGRSGAPAVLTIAAEGGEALFNIGRDLVDDSRRNPIQEQRDKDKLFQSLLRFGPKFGGNQLAKTSLGLRDIDRGFSQFGRSRVPVNTDEDRLRAAAFGPSGTRAAQRHFTPPAERGATPQPQSPQKTIPTLDQLLRRRERQSQ